MEAKNTILDEEQLRKEICLGIKNNYVPKKAVRNDDNDYSINVDAIVANIRKDLGIQTTTLDTEGIPVISNNMSQTLREDENLTGIYKIGKKINRRLKNLKVLSPILEKLKYTIGIKIKYKNYLDINELLQGNDATFIQNAYQVLLNRSVDQAGLDSCIQSLKKTQGNRIIVLGNIRYSREGKYNNVKVKGMLFKYYRIKLVNCIFRIPILGYILQLIVDICTLPRKIRCLYGSIYENNKQQSNITEYVLQSLGSIQSNLTEINATVNETALTRKIDDVIQGEVKSIETNIKQEIKGVVNYIKSEKKEVMGYTKQEIEALLGRLADSKDKIMEEVSNLTDRIDEISGQVFKTQIDKEVKDIYLAFEDKFRGSREEIKNRLNFYLPYFQAIDIENNYNDTTILDIGCGRGELLELLKENRYRYLGIDINHDMVNECKKLDLKAIQGDALAYVKSLESESINAITAIQVVEHINTENLIVLLKECYRVLKKNGAIIFETPNPENLIVGACNFYFDPTHTNPIPPLQLQYLAEATGYSNVQILRQHPYDFINKDDFEKVPAEVKSIVQLFNQEADYAVIAYKK